LESISGKIRLDKLIHLRSEILFEFIRGQEIPPQPPVQTLLRINCHVESAVISWFLLLAYTLIVDLPKK